MVICICGKEFNKYQPRKYGGYAEDLKQELCITCWREYVDMSNRQSRELQEWVKSKGVK